MLFQSNRFLNFHFTVSVPIAVRLIGTNNAIFIHVIMCFLNRLLKNKRLVNFVIVKFASRSLFDERNGVVLICRVVQCRRQHPRPRATLRLVDRTASAERPTDRPSVHVCLRTSAALPAAGLNAL